MTSLSTQIAELKTLVGQCENELLSLQSGKKAAAPRVRASLQKIKTLAHSMRGEVMNLVKELPTKSRVKKETVSSEALPPPPVLERESTEAPVSAPPAPVKKTRAPRKKTIKEMDVE